MTRDETIATIRRTVDTWTGGKGNADPLVAIAHRESGFNAEAKGDLKRAKAAWQRNKPKFVKWENPYTGDDALWVLSGGLYGLMPANMMQSWDPKADPRLIFDPVISTVLAARLWNRALDLGAKTAVDVRMVWAFGPKGLDIPKTAAQYRSRVDLERARWKKLGLAGDPARDSAEMFGLEAFGTSQQDMQFDLAQKVRGGPIAPTAGGSWLMAIALVAAAIWGMRA
jgi:hypothetical protein